MATVAYCQSQPNIVVILVDDAGYKDWGFQGGVITKTPNVDALAQDGTIFSQGYVTNSVCAPSRAGILTGQYQNKFGFEYNIVKYSIAPEHTADDVGLDPHIPTMGNYLKELGYSTSFFGKWHLGEEVHHRPNARGFDHFYGLLGGSRNYNQVERKFDKQLRKNGAVVEPTNNNFYLTDLLTNEAISFMSGQLDDEKPFLAFISYTAPHGPFQAKPADMQLFDDVPNLSNKQKNYYGMIKNVDDNVKLIVELLKDRYAYDNTIFVFLSDNGGKRSIANNGSLRDFKSSQYEGGLRVPFFVTWKNGVPSNNIYANQVISLDLTSTFIKAAGGNLDDNRYFELDGEDLVAAANSDAVLHDRLYWRKKDAWSIVSDGANKLLFNVTDDVSVNDTVFYDLNEDISETTDLYQNNKANVQHLIADYNAWNQKMDLPSWIGKTHILPKLCGEKARAQDCQVLIDEYAAFAASNQLSEISKSILIAKENEATTLNQATLEYADPIKSPAVITYVLKRIPSNGKLKKDGIQLKVGDSFKQLDINSESIAYEHDGSLTTSDSFKFDVHDGSGGETIKNVTFSILFDEVAIYEAENATLTGTAATKTCNNASNGLMVNGLSGGESNAALFNITVDSESDYHVTISYYSKNDREIVYRINGNNPVTETVPASGNWCYKDGSPADVVLTISLIEGMNTLLFYDAPVLDKIQVTRSAPTPSGGVFEAEAAKLTGNPAIASCANASGGKMVKDIGRGPNSALIFENVYAKQTDTYNLTVDYYAAKPTTLTYQLNSATAETVNLPKSGEWCFKGGSPASYTFPITLSTGYNNIKFYDSPTIDKIEVYPIEVPQANTSFFAQLDVKKDNLESYTAEVVPNGIFQGQNAQARVNGKNLDLQKITYSIFDMSGRIVVQPKQQRSPHFEISTDFLGKGLYFLRIDIESKSFIKRIVIR